MLRRGVHGQPCCSFDRACTRAERYLARRDDGLSSVIIMSMVAGIVLRWPWAIIAETVTQHGDIDTGHFRPLRGGVVRHHTYTIFSPVFFESRISLMWLFPLAITLFCVRCWFAAAATGVVVVCVVVSMSVPVLRRSINR